MTRLLKSNIGKLFTADAMIFAFALLQNIIISRILGAEGKGAFTNIQIWPTIVASISMCGLYVGISKIAAQDNWYNKYDLLKTSLLLSSILGIIGTLINIFLIVIIKSRIESELFWLYIIFSIFVLFNNLGRSVISIDLGRRRFGIFSITRMILNPVFFLILFILWCTNSINLTNVVVLISNAFVSIVRILYGISKNERGRPILPLKYLLFRSIPYSVAEISEVTYVYYDKVIVALLLSNYALGLYTVSYSTASILFVVASPFATKLFADSIANSTSNNNSIKILHTYTKLSLLCSLLLALVIPFAIPLIFGDGFRESIYPSYILIILCYIQGRSIILEKFILAKGYPKCISIGKLLSVFMLTASAFLVEGTIGTTIYNICICLCITQIIYNLYLVFYCRKLQSI